MNGNDVIKAETACTPEDAGYCAATLDTIDKHLLKLIADEKITAGAYLLSRGSKVFAHRTMGRSQFGQFRPDTIRWIASTTKIFTALGIIKCIEDGLIYLHQPVREIIKEFDNAMFGTITIYHLLTHSGGIRPDPGCMFEPYPRKGDWFRSKKWIKEALRDNIHYEPGTEWRYSSVGFCILAEIIARITGRDFEEFIIETIIRPLGMDDTFFQIPPEKEGRLFFAHQHEHTMYQQNNKEKKKPRIIPAGGGGLFSTLVDLQKIGQMLINKGTFMGKRIFARKAIESMLRVQFQGVNNTWVAKNDNMEYGLGLNVYTNNTFLSPGSFSHEGAGLCGLYMDPVEDFVFAYFCPLAENTGWEIKAVINFRNLVWSGIL
jgi:serine-type D-Ala-D-Ala carboxypeptidase